MNRIALGVEVRRRRLALGLTQAELATRVGSSRSAISRLEADVTKVDPSLLARVARVSGEPLVLSTPKDAVPISTAERKRRVEAVLGPQPFDPWERDPSPAEAKSLLRDGIVPKSAT